MKILLLVLAGLVGCATVKPVVTPVVTNCGKTVSADILPAVESALVADDWVQQLTALASKFGLCILNNAVAQIMGEAINDQSFASGDVNARLKIDHGNAWLAAHPSP